MSTGSLMAGARSLGRIRLFQPVPPGPPTPWGTSRVGSSHSVFLTGLPIPAPTWLWLAFAIVALLLLLGISSILPRGGGRPRGEPPGKVGAPPPEAEAPSGEVKADVKRLPPELKERPPLI